MDIFGKLKFTIPLNVSDRKTRILEKFEIEIKVKDDSKKSKILKLKILKTEKNGDTILFEV